MLRLEIAFIWLFNIVWSLVKSLCSDSNSYSVTRRQRLNIYLSHNYLHACRSSLQRETETTRNKCQELKHLVTYLLDTKSLKSTPKFMTTVCLPVCIEHLGYQTQISHRYLQIQRNKVTYTGTVAKMGWSPVYKTQASTL